jgi:phosphatidylinositol glycan class O
MKIPNPRLSVLGLLCAFHVVGIYLFTTGFFLARHELPTVSTCEEQDPGVGCWTSGTYDRAIVVIIDALRFDFAYFNKTKLSEKEQREGGSRFFRNKLGVIHDLIEKEPSKARLFKFIADPPTVTMQRLKGMTTGSLPTFLDIKDNFASEAVEEDNIVHQLARHGKKVVMMGDDTWVNLFPESFAEKYPYPSFNVKDLHTVDNGVLEHLMPTIHGGSDARTQGRTDGKGHDADWDVLIAHFLGVDHVGHRYGPEHEWMTRKLTQMDAVLGHIIKAVDPSAPISPHPIPEYGKKGGHREGKGGSVDEDVKGEDTGEPEAGSDLKTLVLVLGDHGMTHDGNHGGASDDETQVWLLRPS